jgi:hypothetical protein
MTVSTTIDTTLGVISAVDAAGVTSSLTVSSPLALSALKLTASAVVTCAGSDQAGATALPSGSALYLLTGTVNQGVRLPAAPAVGDVVVLVNTAAVALKVYPATGGAIGPVAADGASTLAALSVGTSQGANLLLCTDATAGSTNWIRFVTA